MLLLLRRLKQGHFMKKKHRKYLAYAKKADNVSGQQEVTFLGDRRSHRQRHRTHIAEKFVSRKILLRRSLFQARGLLPGLPRERHPRPQ